MRRARPSLADVAREAGVSTATASRALSQPGLVRAPTRALVQAASARLGYVPDRKARALASGRSGTIGAVVPTLNSPIFSEMLHAMQRRLWEEGCQMLVAAHEYDPLAEAAVALQLISHGIDGLVLVGAARPPGIGQAVAAAAIPLVQTWCGVEGHDCVGVDNRLAGRLIARHLLDLGHREIGVIAGHLRSNDRQRLRLEGVRDALAEAGLSLPVARLSEQPLTLSGGRAGCAALLEARPMPTAIVGLVDLLAIGAIIEAQGRGLSVPEALSVGGVDNVDFAPQLSPSLTTVDIPAREIGTEAAMRVLAQIAQRSPARHSLLPIALVVRRSTAPRGGPRLRPL